MVFRHPTVLAGAAASLNEISKGRAILGLGTGDGPVYTQGLKATPIKQFEESVKLIRHFVAEIPPGSPPVSSASLHHQPAGARSTVQCQIHGLQV